MEGVGKPAGAGVTSKDFMLINYISRCKGISVSLSSRVSMVDACARGPWEGGIKVDTRETVVCSRGTTPVCRELSTSSPFPKESLELPSVDTTEVVSPDGS